MPHRYFKRRWDQCRGDQYDDWGGSWWYFELEHSGNVLRQIEVYDNGTLLQYDQDHDDDAYGGLSRSLELEDVAGFEIESQEFLETWSRPATNRR